MSLVLYHRIDDTGYAAVRRRVEPALWDGVRLHEGTGAVLAALETMPR